jgi:hypothetical protein
MDVYRDSASLPGVRVRRALIDLAERHGLIVLAGVGGRGTFAVTQRGLAFAGSLVSTHQPAAVAASGGR